jgi:hypothetical protein
MIENYLDHDSVRLVNLFWLNPESLVSLLGLKTLNMSFASLQLNCVLSKYGESTGIFCSTRPRTAYSSNL